jgi:hypothetical protein
MSNTTLPPRYIPLTQPGQENPVIGTQRISAQTAAP